MTALYEIEVTMPIAVRLYAPDAVAAKAAWARCRLEVTGPMQSHSIGFPLSLEVREVGVDASLSELIDRAIASLENRK